MVSYMPQRSQPIKRKRGIILTTRGWQRLQVAEQLSIDQNNLGKPYTLQELSDLTGLSPNTLARVRSRRVAVDQQTLENYFRAFDLLLGPDDYTDSEANLTFGRSQVPLSGQLPLDSRFYVDRPPAESICYEAILQSGALVRIKSPRQTGKTSLVAKVLSQARDQQMSTAMFSLQLADSTVFTDLKRFIQWFCVVVTRSLGMPNRLDDYWDDLFGVSYNCTNYFESYVLTEIEGSIVLAFDEVDVMFDYANIASDFFGMLRAWHEKARYGDGRSDLWQKLRLVLVHSTEVYVPLNIHQSPFNAGLSIELPNFTQTQVQDLAQRYGLEPSQDYARDLIALVGGNPYLVQLGLHYLSNQEITRSQLLKTAATSDGIYAVHLRKQMWDLQNYPDLVGVLKRVVGSPTPVELEPIQAFKLQSMGLITLSDRKVLPSCDLYRQYFAQILGDDFSGV
jgi:transcriptional regulator with XRE-family HTH domain